MKRLPIIHQKIFFQEIIKNMAKTIIETKKLELEISSNNKDAIVEVVSNLKGILLDNKYINIGGFSPYDKTFDSVECLTESIKNNIVVIENINLDVAFKEIEKAYEKLSTWKNQIPKRQEALKILNQNNTTSNSNSPNINNKFEEFKNKLSKEGYVLDKKELNDLYKNYTDLLSNCDKFNINGNDNLSNEDYSFNKILNLLANSGTTKINEKEKKEILEISEEFIKLGESIKDGINNNSFDINEIESKFKSLDRFSNKNKENAIKTLEDINSTISDLMKKENKSNEEKKILHLIVKNTLDYLNNPDSVVNQGETINNNQQQVLTNQNQSSPFINIENICSGVKTINDNLQKDYQRKQELLNDELNMINNIFNSEIKLSEDSPKEDKKNFLEEKSMKYKDAYSGESYIHSNYLVSPESLSMIDGILTPFHTKLTGMKLINNKALFNTIANIVFNSIPKTNVNTLDSYIECLKAFEVYIINTIKNVFNK